MSEIVVHSLAAPDSRPIGGLRDRALTLGFKLGGVDAESPVLQARYVLLYGDEVHFSGTAQECSAFLIGWGALRSRVLGDLLVAPAQALPEVAGQRLGACNCAQSASLPSKSVPRSLKQGAGAGRPGELAAVRSLPRDQRQGMITAWVETAFGREEATGLPQRGLRLLEEAIEVFQACGGHEELARELLTRVFSHPPGMLGQELGGVAVTVLALAAATGLSAEEEECREVHRVLSMPVDEFSSRNAHKIKISAEHTLLRNPCCGNVGTRGEGGREHCATCGADLGAIPFP